MKNNFKPIQSIQRAVNIIDCFSDDKYELTLNEISTLVELNINTTRGLVNTLVSLDLITHNPNNTYSLGYYYFSKIELIQKRKLAVIKEISFKYLTELAEKYQVSSRINMISSNKILTLNVVTPKNAHYLLVSKENIPFPLHATASGKILLSYGDINIDDVNLEQFTQSTITKIDTLNKHLSKIRENGYSTEINEAGDGISSIAVPIFNKDNTLLGTVSLTALTPVILDIIDSASSEMINLSKKLSSEISILYS